MAVLVTAVQLWTLAFVLLKAAEHFSNGHLSTLLSRHNIKLHYCFISVHTTRFNTPLETHSRRRRAPLTYWYSAGVLFGLLGLLLSLILLFLNLYLATLDFLQPLPAIPPPPPHALRPPPHPDAPPSPHHARSAAALAAATLRGAAARIPFMHGSPRPWWLPPAMWHRMTPRDHAPWDATALASATRSFRSPGFLPNTRRYAHPYGHAGPPPHGHPHGHGPGRHHHRRGHGRRHHHPPPPPPPPPGVSPLPEGHPLPPPPRPGDHPHKRPCKNRPPQTPWNRPLAALPAPGDTSALSAVPDDGEEEDDEAEERDLFEKGEKSQVTITWRRKPLSVPSTPAEDAGARQVGKEEEQAEVKVPSSERFDSASANATLRDSNHATLESGKHASLLVPLVPGITVPPGDLWYMIAAVLIAAVVHELGHALAAGMQNANVTGVGGFVALALPGAYVQLTGIEEMATLAQLRVYCAGAWHNLVVAFFALLAVGWLPLAMAGFYHMDSGALVVSLPELSPLQGHLEPGDVILSLGRFEVTDGGPSFRKAVSNLILTNDTVGFCVSEDLYRNYSKPRSSCCDDEHMRKIDADTLPDKCFRVQGIERRTSCIDPVGISSQPTCRFTNDCSRRSSVRRKGGRVAFSRVDSSSPSVRAGLDAVSRFAPVQVGSVGSRDGSESDKEGTTDEKKTSCFLPVLPMRQQLVDVRVRGARTGQVVHFFYEGYPEVLGQSVTVSSYLPRVWWIAPVSLVQILAVLDIPNMIERLLQYLSSISLALAILNMAPVFFLDGEVSSVLFVRLFAPKMSVETTQLARQIIVCSGSALLVLNILVALFEVEAWQ